MVQTSFFLLFSRFIMVRQSGNRTNAIYLSKRGWPCPLQTRKLCPRDTARWSAVKPADECRSSLHVSVSRVCLTVCAICTVFSQILCLKASRNLSFSRCVMKGLRLQMIFRRHATSVIKTRRQCQGLPSAMFWQPGSAFDLQFFHRTLNVSQVGLNQHSLGQKRRRGARENTGKIMV